MATPSKRTRITNQTKEDIKKDSKKPGFKIEDAMKKHGLGMSTLYRILKEELIIFIFSIVILNVC